MQGGGAPGGAGEAGRPGGAPPTPFMQPPTSPFAPAPKTLLDRVFPLVHILSMVGLAAYVIFVYEPAQRLSRYGWTGENGGVDWYAWGSLLSRQPKALESAVAQRIGFGTLSEVVRPFSPLSQLLASSRADLELPNPSQPLLWMFVSVELVLQTTRLFLVRVRPTSSCMPDRAATELALTAPSAEPSCAARHPQLDPPPPLPVLAAARPRPADRRALLRPLLDLPQRPRRPRLLHRRRRPRRAVQGRRACPARDPDGPGGERCQQGRRRAVEGRRRASRAVMSCRRVLLAQPGSINAPVGAVVEALHP